VALFQLESSSNEEMEFERFRFRELGCGCSHSLFYMRGPLSIRHLLRQVATAHVSEVTLYILVYWKRITVWTLHRTPAAWQIVT
jgi:hypothetical protein